MRSCYDSMATLVRISTDLLYKKHCYILGTPLAADRIFYSMSLESLLGALSFMVNTR